MHHVYINLQKTDCLTPVKLEFLRRQKQRMKNNSDHDIKLIMAKAIEDILDIDIQYVFKPHFSLCSKNIKTNVGR